jgi:hypothetical protein
MMEARQSIKTYQYPHAIELAKQAERMLSDLKSTSRPIIDLEITFEKEPWINRWGVVDLNILNKGTAMARDLHIESPLFVNTQDLHILGRLEAGKNILMTIRWLPHLSGRVPLNIFIKYTDPFGKEDTVVKTFDIEVKEAEVHEAESPYKAGAYAFEHHEDVTSYAALEADQAAYGQTEKVHMEQEPHEVEVEDFHDKFDVEKSHTEESLKGQSPQEEKPSEKTDFDIDDIISELMTQNQKQKDEEPAEDTPLPTHEEHTVVTPSKVLMPKAKNEDSEDEN